MKRLIGNISARYQTLLRSAAWGVLIVLFLASLPFLFGPVSRGLDWVVSAFEQAMKGALMVLLTDVLFGLLFVLFSYWMVVARTRRQVLALTLAGVLVVALVSPPAAQAQGEPYRSNSIRAECDQRLDQDGNELDQFGSHGDQQFLPAGDLAGCPNQPGEGDGDANDRPVQKSYAEHFQHQPK